MGNFDEAAVLAVARAPGSQVLLPMKASGKWNMDGAGSNEIGGELTKEVCARELEARGVAVKRNNPGTKHAGEVHASETLVILKKRLKDHCGTHLVIKLTDDDGDLKSARRGWSERLPTGARPAVIDMTDLTLSPPPWGAPMDEDWPCAAAEGEAVDPGAAHSNPDRSPRVPGAEKRQRAPPRSPARGAPVPPHPPPTPPRLCVPPRGHPRARAPRLGLPAPSQRARPMTTRHTPPRWRRRRNAHGEPVRTGARTCNSASLLKHRTGGLVFLKVYVVYVACCSMYPPGSKS